MDIDPQGHRNVDIDVDVDVDVGINEQRVNTLVYMHVCTYVREYVRTYVCV